MTTFSISNGKIRRIRFYLNPQEKSLQHRLNNGFIILSLNTKDNICLAFTTDNTIHNGSIDGMNSNKQLLNLLIQISCKVINILGSTALQTEKGHAIQIFSGILISQFLAIRRYQIRGNCIDKITHLRAQNRGVVAKFCFDFL